MDAFLTYVLHTSVLTVSELRESLTRRRAIIGIVLYVLIFLLAAYYLVEMQREIGPGLQVIQHKLSEPQVAHDIDQYGKEGFRAALKYLAAQPNGVWLFQFIALAWYPVFITLMSFDCVASDVHRGTPRFVVQRASRASYLSSKYFSQIILYLVLHLLAITALFLAYAVWLPSAAVGIPLIQYGGVMLAFLAVVTSATVFVSSLSGSAGRALVWIHFFWFLVGIVGIFWPWLNPLRGDWLAALMVPERDAALLAIAGFWIWTAVFFVAGLVCWESREL